MSDRLLKPVVRISLIILFVIGAIWAFAYGLSWLESAGDMSLLARFASSDPVVTVLFPIVPATFWGSLQIVDYGTKGLVFCEWGSAAIYLLVAALLLWKERIGIALAGLCSAINSIILAFQLVALARDASHQYPLTGLVVSRGLLVIVLIVYAIIAYRLLRLTTRTQHYL